jgi:phospholipid transport system substrate-binding protein
VTQRALAARFVLIVGLGVSLVALTPLAGQATESDPSPLQVVERLHGTLLELMQRAEELGYAGRARTIDPVVRETYDVATIARLSLGRYWRELAPEDQGAFVELLTRLVVANYAGRFDGFAGETLEVVSEEEAPSQSRLVRTRIVRPDAEPVRLDYRLRRRNERWQIVDVFLDSSVSELALRRAEYSAVIQRSGYAELAQALESRIEALERAQTGEPAAP